MIKSTLLGTVTLLALTLGGVAEAQIAKLYGPNELPELGRGEGYVLIGVDSGNTESFLTVTALAAKGRRAMRAGKELATEGPSFRIELSGKATGFYFAVLPAGLYQITEINYPYFNLPFRLNTTENREWRFFVAQEKTNYAGRVVIARERSEDALDVNLINRTAADLEYITDTYAAVLANYPLASGIGIRDDFLDYISAQ